LAVLKLPSCWLRHHAVVQTDPKSVHSEPIRSFGVGVMASLSPLHLRTLSAHISESKTATLVTFASENSAQTSLFKFMKENLIL
jgi:hypothetical protein